MLLNRFKMLEQAGSQAEAWELWNAGCFACSASYSSLTIFGRHPGRDSWFSAILKPHHQWFWLLRMLHDKLSDQWRLIISTIADTNYGVCLFSTGHSSIFTQLMSNGRLFSWLRFVIYYFAALCFYILEPAFLLVVSGAQDKIDLSSLTRPIFSSSWLWLCSLFRWPSKGRARGKFGQ